MKDGTRHKKASLKLPMVKYHYGPHCNKCRHLKVLQTPIACAMGHDHTKPNAAKHCIDFRDTSADRLRPLANSA